MRLSETARNLNNSEGERASGPAPLRRAASILDAVAAARGDVTLQQICDAVGLPVSTTYRLTQSLVAIDYLALDADRKRYRIGDRLVRLVHISQDTASVKMQSEPILKRLANQFGHTAFLTQLVGDEIALVSYVLPASPIGSVIYPGHRFPMHATATGKATFAYQPADVVDRLLLRPLEKLQERTIVDPEGIRREFARIRSLGYAVIDSEFDSGVVAIGCPVISVSGSVTFAVGIVGLEVNMRKQCAVEDYAQALKTATRELANLIARV